MTEVPTEGSVDGKLPAGLYLVGTPIGNLGDFTFRALETLRACDVILAEDTRITKRLLNRYEINKPLVSYHKFNEAKRTDEVVQRIASGEVIALVTDSGMPGVSDPGARVVHVCREHDLLITAIPGPSALATAIALCGIQSVGYVFGGFLPHKSGARKRTLEKLLLAELPVVLYESPYRLHKLMAEVEEVVPEAQVFVGRELTKKFEECRFGQPAEIVAAYGTRTIKGELVVVIEKKT